MFYALRNCRRLQAKQECAPGARQHPRARNGMIQYGYYSGRRERVYGRGQRTPSQLSWKLMQNEGEERQIVGPVNFERLESL